jgi:hypothetical protein
MIAGLLTAVAPLAAQPMSPPAKPLTVGDVCTMVENSCVGRNGTVFISDLEKAKLRKDFVLSDRLVTRRAEALFTQAVTWAEACFQEPWTRLIDQFGNNPTLKDSTVSLAAERSAAFRLRQTQKFRDLLVLLGYRPSQPAPGPRFGFCEVIDEYSHNDGGF